MDAEYGRTSFQRGKVQYLCLRQGLLGRDVEQAVDHAFTGYAYEYWPPHGDEPVQVGEQTVILLYGLGKAETGIKNPVADTVLFRSFPEFSEIFQYFFHHILILAERLPRLCIAT